MSTTKSPSDSRILSAEAPVASKSSYGRWVVYYLTESPFGTMFFRNKAYFWRKADALKFVASVKS